MEGIDHVDVVEVGGSGLVGEVDGVLEREVPDGEGLELRVAGADAALVLMVELAEAGGHFAAAGAWGGDDHEAAGSFYVVVAAEAVVGDDEGDVGGVVGDDVVAVDLDAEGFEPVLELVGRWPGRGSV